MLLIEASNIKKYFGDRLIINIDSLKIYINDRIGVVGANGAGKTTLMNILSRAMEPDEGSVRLYGECSYITQLEDRESPETESFLSGGEKTRLRIARGFGKESVIMFADEPTSNLDIKAIGQLEKRLLEYEGALLMVSHDRMLLDKVCNKIMEVESGSLRIYNGNYSAYRQQKDAETARQQFEYDDYMTQKRKLEAAINEKKYKVGSMKKTPSRMGNSEARLHRMGNQKAQANMNRTIKAMESRVERLEVKEKPRQQQKAIIDIQDADGIISKNALAAKGISKSFGSRVLLDEVEFVIPKGLRTALIGDNGTGKTTLLDMIIRGCEGIRLSPGVKPGYFRQNLDSIEEELSIFDNVMKGSIYPEAFTRNILARLLFRRDEIYKKVGVLSGGERVRVCFAKLLTGDVNFIILDEPTNYLDIYSMEAVENALLDYKGTLLFVSHDRSFITRVAQRMLLLEDNGIKTFEGCYDEYLESLKAPADSCHKNLEEERMLVENRITEVLGRLSAPTKKDDVQQLDAEYKVLLTRLKEIRG